MNPTDTTAPVLGRPWTDKAGLRWVRYHVPAETTRTRAEVSADAALFAAGDGLATLDVASAVPQRDGGGWIVELQIVP